MEISKYFASLGIRITKSSVDKVDKTLDKFEARIRKFGKIAGKPITLDITKFNVDQAKLTLALGNALDAASPRVAFEITRFVVNDRALLLALLRAARRLPPGPNPPPHPPGGGPNPPDTRTRRTTVAGFGGWMGGMGGILGAGLALGLGGYGLSNLNQRNQQVVSAQLQTQAVVQQAGGTPQQGTAAFDWLKSEGNRVGFNYLEAAPDFSKLTAGLTGAGMSVKESQNVFKGFSELSRVNKLDKTQQSRVYRALSQVAGKNKLQSEELVGQLAESLPGAVSLFAQAYQRQLTEKGKGGGLTGQAAISQLYADMKKGLVKGDILTYAGAEASNRAGPGLAAASTASQAEQARAQNELNNQAIIASNAGIEEGFARIFRTLAVGLSESGGLTSTLAGWFNDATQSAEKLALFPQSFARALEGRDSLVADWLGEGQTKQLREDWSDIKISLDSIFNMSEPSWLPSLKDVAQTLKDLIGVAGAISSKYREIGAAAQQIQLDSIDEYGPKLGGVIGLAKANYFTLSSALGLGEQAAGFGLNKAMDTIPFARRLPVSGLMGDFANYLSTPNDTYAKYYMNRDQGLGLNTDAMYGSSTEGWRDFNRDQNRAAATDVFGSNGYGPSAATAASIKSSSDAYLQGETQEKSTTSNVFNMEFHMSGDPDTMENWFRTSLTKEIEKVMPNLPEK